MFSFAELSQNGILETSGALISTQRNITERRQEQVYIYIYTCLLLVEFKMAHYTRKEFL